MLVDYVQGDGKGICGRLETRDAVVHGAGPWPAVILIGGSGPTDRDGTAGCLKILKDLAWGLASAGVAVLRCDKVNRAHPAEVLANPDFGVLDEYLPDAAAGLALLASRPEADASRTVVAGHSLGGTMAPAVATAADRAGHPVAGVILLAGGGVKMYRSLVRQMKRLAGPDGEGQYAELAAQVDAIESPDYAEDSGLGGGALGAPNAAEPSPNRRRSVPAILDAFAPRRSRVRTFPAGCFLPVLGVGVPRRSWKATDQTN